MLPELSGRLQAALGDAFTIEQEMKSGGMSRLFLATEVSLNRQVVVKVLPPELTSEVSLARFKQEMEVTAHLQHPHILPVLTAGSSDNLLYYIMPYVAGESLRDRMEKEGSLPVDFSLRILGEVADALAHAHEHGVVHRDLKPENILLEGDHAVLADFGIARALLEVKGGERLTGTGLSVGTPGYMSPEQAAGERHVDARADIYALAVVGYEMLAGQPPFDAPTAQAMVAAHLTETPRPVSELRRATPARASDVIARALSKDPADRVQTAAEFRAAIEGARATPARTTRAGRRILLAGAVGAAAVVAAVLLWPDGGTSVDPRKSLIVFPFQNRTGDPANDWLQEASMNLLGLGLSHWEDLTVFDDERTASLMRRSEVRDPQDLDFDRAQAMARRAKVGTLVLGDIRREGDSLAFEAKVHDVGSGDRLATEIVRVERTADPRVSFDSLTAKILRVSGAPVRLRPGLVTQTTRSLEAYRAYLRGSVALQAFDTDSADVYFARAVELDSTFALAYIGLRNNEGWRPGGSDPKKRRQFIAKAEAHSQALPPRIKLLVEFHSAYESDQLRKARSIAERLIARDSTDVEAWFQLGEAHYHHGSTHFPHPDTLGNIGTALAAFRRAQSLDPSYTLAYLHIVQSWGTCSIPEQSYVCLRDSAVYGTPDELEGRFGGETLAELRRAAADSQVAAAYQWVSASPNTVLARTQLADILVQQGRWREAGNQAAFLRNLGLESRALGLEALSLYGQGKFADALEPARAAIAGLSDSASLAEWEPYAALVGIPAAAGHPREDVEMLNRLLRAVPIDTLPLYGIALPKPVVMAFVEFYRVAQSGTDSAHVSRAGRELLRLLRESVDDSVAYRRVLAGESDSQDPTSPFLMAYLTSGDTALLAHFVDYIDRDRWPSARAGLALARGDSAQARALLAGSQEPGGGTTFASEDEFIETYAWSWLRSRLGDPSGAVETYERLDHGVRLGPAKTEVTGLLILSWAERGALYQQLGNRNQAIAMYQKFIDAWRDGDENAQVLVDRARQTVASLKGEVSPVERIP